MGRRRRDLPAAQVAAVRRRIEQWRRAREKRSPMPEQLWGAAASLARGHGVYPIARALRVSYETLRRRVGPVTNEGREGPSGVDFVALDGAQLLGSVPPAGSVVELADAAGARVVIRLPPGQVLDVLGLSVAFWQRT